MVPAKEMVRDDDVGEGTAGKVGNDKKLQGKAKADKSKRLPENSNLKIAEEEKKRWETATGGT